MTRLPARFAAAATLALTLATAALAQVFPSENGTPIIDDAALLPDDVEARIVGELATIKAQNGAEVWVVTLPNTALYTAGEEIAAYAELLYAELGLSEVVGGKAALLLVFAEDRELYVKSGTMSAEQAQAIITGLIQPAFAQEDYAQGIEAGVQGMIGQLVAPPPATTATEEPVPAASETPAPPQGGGGALWWVLGGLVAVVGGIVAMVKRSAAKLAATPCPSCGKTGLTRASVVLQEATEKAEGRGETRTTCPHCAHVTAVPYTIAKKERAASDKAAPKGPGAGPKDKGQGGGASGSW